MKKNYEAIVIGSGPGGATVAREMAKNGKSVLLLEKGNNKKCTGSNLNALLMFDRFGFFKARKALQCLRLQRQAGQPWFIRVPPPWLKTKYNIDLEQYADETNRELNVCVLPDHLVGEASTLVIEAGNRLGQAWEPMPKLLDITKFKNGKSSGARTSLGLNYGERWTARDFVQQAVTAGATLLTQTECTEIIVKEGVTKGVRVRLKTVGSSNFTVIISSLRAAEYQRLYCYNDYFFWEKTGRLSSCCGLKF